MKTRKLFVLITVILLIASLSISAYAAEWNLAQGDLNITKDGSYTVTSTDKAGKQTTTKNAITIADDVEVTITLDQVAMEGSIQLGDSASVTLNLVGDNSILNDSAPAIENNGGNLTITSQDGGTLKLRKDEPAVEVTKANIEVDALLALKDLDASKFVVVENEGYVLVESSQTDAEIEVGTGSIVSIEVIADETVPLSDGKDATSTLVIEGNAQVDSGSDIYSGNGTYVIGMDTVINGTNGWDIETLAKHVPYEKDYANLILMVNGQELDNCRILKNKGKNITVIVSDADGKVKLTESKLKNKALTEGIESEAILHTCNLNLGNSYEKNFVVRFHLGEQYAGKTVEVRTMDNDKMVAETITVGESGIAAIAASASGDFALIAK